MTNPRELALLILIETQRGSYSNLALNKYLKGDISPQDRAFVTELVYGVIKYKLRLDYIISQFSKIKTSKMSYSVINILRLGVYQMFFLDKVPDFAAINESVDLAKKRENRKTANFVNAVLRNIARNKQSIIYPDPAKSKIEYLCTFYSFPKWMIQRWLNLYGYEFTRELCESFNERSKVCIRVNTLKINENELKKRLDSEQVKYTLGFFLEEALYIEDSPRGSITQLESFNNGFFQPQDESSMLVSRALGVKSGELVLDAAAAPGGKTTHLAQLMKNDGRIIAWDIHPHRVKLIKEACKRLGVTIVDTEVRDARICDESKFGKFDKVLVDAPCSGSGVIRRKPDIKWAKTPDDIKGLNLEQQKILNACAKYVKPNGILVYSTCSIEPEENQKIVEAFLNENKDFVYDDLRPYLPEKLAGEVKKPFGSFQLYPNLHKTDGFFISRLKKV